MQKIFDRIPARQVDLYLVLFATLLAVIAFYAIGFRSFWMDEAMLGIAVVDSPINDFIPLKTYEQATPAAHYFISKAVIALIGKSDVWLRLPSLLIFTSCVALAIFSLKDFRHKIVLLTMLFASPEILRYATEYKHYIFELAFSLIIVCSWISRKNKFDLWVYALAILLSTIATYSLVFVIFSIFLLELILGSKTNSRAFQIRWLFLHALYGAVFLAVYIYIVKPSTSVQMANWKEVYEAGLLSQNWRDMNAWRQLPKSLAEIWRGSEKLAILLFPFLVVAGYNIIRNARSASPFLIRAFLLLIVIIALVYLASLMGFYSIQHKRHFLFLAPPFILLVIGLLETGSKKTRTIIFASFACLTVVFGCIAHNKYSFFFQETKSLIRRPHDIDMVFIGAQPAYDWYVMRDSTREEYINPITAPRLIADANIDALALNLPQPGAWSWVWSLKYQNRFTDYLSWLAQQAVRRGKVNILFTDYTTENFDSIKYFRSQLPAHCQSSVLDEDMLVAILTIACEDK